MKRRTRKQEGVRMSTKKEGDRGSEEEGEE